MGRARPPPAAATSCAPDHRQRWLRSRPLIKGSSLLRSRHCLRTIFGDHPNHRRNGRNRWRPLGTRTPVFAVRAPACPAQWVRPPGLSLVHGSCLLGDWARSRRFRALTHPPCFAHREARQDDLAARAIQFEMPEWHGHQMSAKSHEVAYLERREPGAVIPADHEPINGADRLLLGVHADRDDLDLLRQRRLWAHRDQDRCGQHRGQEP